jgi:hypothetical protein
MGHEGRIIVELVYQIDGLVRKLLFSYSQPMFLSRGTFEVPEQRGIASMGEISCPTKERAILSIRRQEIPMLLCPDPIFRNAVVNEAAQDKL